MIYHLQRECLSVNHKGVFAIFCLMQTIMAYYYTVHYINLLLLSGKVIFFFLEDSEYRQFTLTWCF